MVDDEAMVRRNCEKILAKEGYDVISAESGEYAIEKLKQCEFYLILIDLKMPGMDGRELLKKVCQEFPRIIPIIITGYATVESAVESMKKGAYDYIPKPFTTSELLMVVKNAIDKRKLMDEAERFRREKEEFILRVYHELKSPISIIFGYLQNVLQTPLPDREMKMLIRCRERTKGLIELVDDLLGMSRLQERNTQADCEPLQISEMLTPLVEALRDEAKANNIAVQLSLAEEFPSIKGNRKDLETAFTNLVRNAVRYNKNGGRVKIAADTTGNFVIVRIEDTGIGIKPDDIPRIFDEFFRVKNENTRQIAGTGLGLAITKTIIDAHGGHIEVKSEIGKGSKFNIYLQKHSKSQLNEQVN